MKVEMFKIPSHFWLHARTQQSNLAIFPKQTVEDLQLDNQFIPVFLYVQWNQQREMDN
jgi:hypothetical protein